MARKYPGSVGTMESIKGLIDQYLAGKGYRPKATAERPRWVWVEVGYRETFRQPLTLKAIKADPQFADLELVNRSRLSIQKVAAEQFEAMLRLCRG